LEYRSPQKKYQGRPRGFLIPRTDRLSPHANFFHAPVRVELDPSALKEIDECCESLAAVPCAGRHNFHQFSQRIPIVVDFAVVTFHNI
jgi:hypothetical protein